MRAIHPPRVVPSKIDGDLRAFCSPKQWGYYCAWVKLRSFRAVARAAHIHDSTLRESIASIYAKAARHGYAPDHDLTHPLPDGLVLAGTSVRYDGEGRVDQYWNKSKPEGRDPANVVKLSDPKVVSKVSTLYDQGGQVVQQWVAEKPADAERLRLWRVAAEEMAADLPRVPPIKHQEAERDDVMDVFPVGDHHLGMLSWPEETGGAWDVGLAEKALGAATDHLIQVTPASEQALIAFLGDFMHFDGFAAVTPTSRNLLDSDTRFPKLVRSAIRSMRRMIESVARKHPKVRVIVEIGNHDLASSIFLMECLSNIYEGNPRIQIDTSPRFFHYFQFGKVLIGTHHGHEAKAERLPSIMAADEPRAWGETEHRYWLTGHVHHQSVKDFERCSVESFRILAPADAWASQKGYRSKREMKALVMHREHGEVARHSVIPSMFE